MFFVCRILPFHPPICLCTDKSNIRQGRPQPMPKMVIRWAGLEGMGVYQKGMHKKIMHTNIMCSETDCTTLNPVSAPLSTLWRFSSAMSRCLLIVRQNNWGGGWGNCQLDRLRFLQKMNSERCYLNFLHISQYYKYVLLKSKYMRVNSNAWSTAALGESTLVKIIATQYTWINKIKKLLMSQNKKHWKSYKSQNRSS